MGKVTVYNFLTLNGYFKGPDEDISWHQHGKEEGEYAEKSAGQENVLLFGRTTYEHMASFWPTPMAKQQMPKLADEMNRAEKVVFSRTMKSADWNNTKVSSHLIEDVKQWKAAGKNMTVLGSGKIISQLTDAGLIDGFAFMIDPVALGSGIPVFKGIHKPLKLKLISSHPFPSGVILLNYEPA